MIWDVEYDHTGDHLAATQWNRSEARIFDMEEGQPARAAIPAHGMPSDVAFHPSGEFIAIADHAVRIVRVDDQTEAHVFPSKGGQLVRSVAFSPEGGRLAAAFDDGSVIVREWSSGAILSTFGHEDTVWCVEFGPGGSALAVTTSMNGEARLWNTDTGEELASLSVGRLSALGARFRADGAQIAIATWGGAVELWEPFSTGSTTTRLRHPAGVFDVDYHPSKPILATGLADGGVQLWNTDSLTELGPHSGTMLSSPA
jgi:WD40 repeat protein